jgi:hypothetical protein
MRKISYLFFLLAIAGLVMFTGTGVSAQEGGADKAITAGNILLSGATNLTIFQKISEEKESKNAGTQPKYKDESTSFGLSTTAGYFVINGLAVGAILDYEKTSSESKVDGTKTGEDKESSWQLGPKVYYFIGGLGVAIPYVSLAFVFGSRDSEEKSITGPTSSTTKYESSFTGWGLGIGCSVLVTESVALFGEFNYMMYSGENKNVSTGSTDKGDDISKTEMSIMIGVQAFISTGGM